MEEEKSKARVVMKESHGNIVQERLQIGFSKVFSFSHYSCILFFFATQKVAVKTEYILQAL